MLLLGLDVKMLKMLILNKLILIVWVCAVTVRGRGGEALSVEVIYPARCDATMVDFFLVVELFHCCVPHVDREMYFSKA